MKLTSPSEEILLYERSSESNLMGSPAVSLPPPTALKERFSDLSDAQDAASNATSETDPASALPARSRVSRRGPQLETAETAPVRLPKLSDRFSILWRAKRVAATEVRLAPSWTPVKLTAVTAYPMQVTPLNEQGDRRGSQLGRTVGFGSELLKEISSFKSSEDAADNRIKKQKEKDKIRVSFRSILMERGRVFPVGFGLGC